MNGLNKLAIFIGLLASLALFSVESFACVCASSKPSEAVKEADAVFIGKVSKEIIAGRKWKVTVSSVLKGEVKKTITFYAAMVGTSCEASDFGLGKTYVFFANKLTAKRLRDEETNRVRTEDREKIGHYEPRVCGWNTLLSDWDTEEYRNMLKDVKDEDFLKFLKKGRKPRN